MVQVLYTFECSKAAYNFQGITIESYQKYVQQYQFFTFSLLLVARSRGLIPCRFVSG